MSRLENRVRPILIPLLAGRSLVLNKERQEVLATWLATRLLVAEFSDPVDQLVTPQIERSLSMGRRLPPDIMRIWIGCADKSLSNLYYRHAAPMAITLPGRQRKPAPKTNNIQAQTLVIGDLFVQAITTTVLGVKFNAPTYWRLRQLWPYKRDFAWPRPFPVTFDLSSEIARALEQTRTVNFPGRPPSIKATLARS